MTNESAIPTFMTRFLAYWQYPSTVEVKPATCSWVAACPHCRSDADWFSSANTNSIRYTMACPQCGEITWSPTRAEL